MSSLCTGLGPLLPLSIWGEEFFSFFPIFKAKYPVHISVPRSLLPFIWSNAWNHFDYVFWFRFCSLAMWIYECNYFVVVFTHQMLTTHIEICDFSFVDLPQEDSFWSQTINFPNVNSSCKFNSSFNLWEKERLLIHWRLPFWASIKGIVCVHSTTTCDWFSVLIAKMY